MDSLQTTTDVFDLQPLIAFIAYMVMIILVGIYASRFSSKGIANFFIGGRKMGSLKK